MQIIKKGLLAVMAGCFVISLSACSFDGVVDQFLSKTDPREEKTEELPEEETPTVDVAKPELTVNLSGSNTYTLDQEAAPLTVEAKVSDSGTLSYQWYRNITNSNGGGTPIEGAVQASFKPLTNQEGTAYYYAVAMNTIGSSSQSITTDTVEVIVSAAPPAEEPEEAAPAEDTKEAPPANGWQQDSTGWFFKDENGSMIKNEWKQIDSKWYVFNENGYIRTGWHQDKGSWYYLNKDGSMAMNTDIEGYHLGEDGKMAQ